MNERLFKVVNFAGFQLNWFACILGAAAGRPWLGPLVVACTLAVHLRLCRSWRTELMILIAAGVIGFVFDSAVVLAGAFDFTEGAVLGRPTTVWMVAMWMNFAATLRASMGWLQGRLVASAVVGLICGPLAYYAGARLGAIVLPEPAWTSLAVIAAEWAVATPLLVRIAALATERDRRPADAVSPVAPEIGS